MIVFIIKIVIAIAAIGTICLLVSFAGFKFAAVFLPLICFGAGVALLLVGAYGAAALMLVLLIPASLLARYYFRRFLS